jgi:hypothetical protein
MPVDETDGPISRGEVEQRINDAIRPPVVDPTANVLQLVAAAMTRQDDLRNAEARRQDDLIELEREHRKEIRELEAKYRDAQSTAESRRLDALLSAQNAAVAIAAARAESTASALAERVDTAAKTLAAEAGSKEQRIDNRATGQWTFQQALTILGIGAGVVYFLLNQPVK